MSTILKSILTLVIDRVMSALIDKVLKPWLETQMLKKEVKENVDKKVQEIDEKVQEYKKSKGLSKEERIKAAKNLP